MSYGEVKKNIVRNAVSNYIRTVVTMAVGLVTFRLLFQALSTEEFGFWSLLWSVFGYGILLDFGFGFAAQKRVAELSVKQDWPELSRVLSTILFFYFGVAAGLALVVLLGSSWIIRMFDVSAQNMETFRRLLVVFFVGIGLAFPMGLFPEMLRGQQRIRLANYLATAFTLLRLVLIWLAIQHHWGFMAIMVIALGCSLVPDFIAAPLALQKMPEVRLRPSLFSRAAIGSTAKFSIFAYLSTATNLVLAKTDQLILGACLSVAAVTLYQAGAKVAEVFRDFTKQLQDTLSPAAAHLHAMGDHAALQDLMRQSLRWCVIIATPLGLLCTFYLEELLSLLTGEETLAPEVYWVAYTMLAWHYTSLLTHSVSKRIFIMTGHEQRLMWLGLGEAIANLALSIALVWWFGNVLAVAVGSLLPSLYFGWVYLWPWMAREGGMRSWHLLKQAVFPAWLGCLPMLGTLLLLKGVALAPGGHALAAMVVESLIAMVAALAGLWFLCLRQVEREAMGQLLVKLKLRRTPS